MIRLISIEFSENDRTIAARGKSGEPNLPGWYDGDNGERIEIEQVYESLFAGRSSPYYSQKRTMFSRLEYHKSDGPYRLILAGCLLTLWPSSTLANAVFPPSIMVFPTAWYLIFPVILFETFVAAIVMDWQFGRSFLMSLTANLASSLVGLPVAYVDIIALKEFEFRLWYFPAIVFPLYAVSVLVEGLVAIQFVRKGTSVRRVWRWALIANTISYLLFLLVLCLLVSYVF